MEKETSLDFRTRIQEEAVETALREGSGTLSLSVRLGKTLCGLRIASKYKKVLVSYPNTPIKDSWLKDSVKFGINIDHITFTTHLSLFKHDLSSFDCLIIDELHSVSIAQIEALIANLGDIALFGLSGTVPVFGKKKWFMDNYCPIIYEKTLDETTGLTNKDYQITVHLLKPSEKKDIPLKNGGFWSEKAKIGFFESKYRATRQFNVMLMLIRAIMESKTKLNYVKQLSNKLNRALIFLETTEQCKQLNYPSFHAKEKNSELHLEQFQSGEIDKLLCIKMLDSGITFNSLDTVILLHCYSSNNKAHQRIARALNYVEGEKADIHIIGLQGTSDEKWISKGLSEFSQDKIKYIKI